MESLNTQKQPEFKETDILSLKKSVQMKSKTIEAASSETNKEISEQGLVVAIPKASIQNSLEKRFGWFNCKSCKRIWTSRSVFCYRGTNNVFIQQTCNRCNNVVLPHKVKKIEKSGAKKAKPTKNEKENKANLNVNPTEASEVADKAAVVTNTQTAFCPRCESIMAMKSEVKLEGNKIDSSNGNHDGVNGEVTTTNKSQPSIQAESSKDLKKPDQLEQMTKPIAAVELTNRDTKVIPSTISSNGTSPKGFIIGIVSRQCSENAESGNKGESSPMEANEGGGEGTGNKSEEGSGSDEKGNPNKEDTKESNDGGNDDQSDRGKDEDKDGKDEGGNGDGDGDSGKDEDSNDKGDDGDKDKDGDDDDEGNENNDDGNKKDGDDKNSDDKESDETKKVDDNSPGACAVEDEQSKNQNIEEVDNVKQVKIDDQKKEPTKPSEDVSGSVIGNGDEDDEGIRNKPGNPAIGTNL